VSNNHDPDSSRGGSLRRAHCLNGVASIVLGITG
jgi:hypothetical protein